MTWRSVVVLFLLIVSISNAVIRLWGDWPTFFAVLGAQSFFVFGGVYPFLYGKTMWLRFGVELRSGENADLRTFIVLGYVLLYALMFFAS